MRRPADLPPLVPPGLAALAAGAVLLWANFGPRRGVVVTSDDGVGPGSWTLRFGWPRDFYQSFGNEPESAGMCCWCPGGLALDVALGLLLMAGIAALAATLSRPR